MDNSKDFGRSCGIGYFSNDLQDLLEIEMNCEINIVNRHVAIFAIARNFMSKESKPWLKVKTI